MIATAPDPAQARRDADHILSSRRFTGSPVPRPLHSVLRWIGDRLSTVTHWIGDRFSWLPGPGSFWLGATAIVVAGLAVAFIVYLTAQSRARNLAVRGGTRSGTGLGNAVGENPTALEAAATDAEAQGDLALAVRLRFRAGLLRLDRDARAITYRSSLPTGEVRAELGSAEFDELADTFEGIAYGGNPAAPSDTAEARRDWPRVVADAKRR